MHEEDNVTGLIHTLNEIPLSLMVRLRGHDPYCVI